MRRNLTSSFRLAGRPVKRLALELLWLLDREAPASPRHRSSSVVGVVLVVVAGLAAEAELVVRVLPGLLRP